MSSSPQFGLRVLATALLSIVSAGVWAQPQRPPVTKFSADVTIERSIVDNDGKDVGLAMSPLRYKLERSRDGREWKTTLVFQQGSPGPGVSVDAPRVVRRIEYGSTLGSAQMFDEQGRTLALPEGAPLRSMPLESAVADDQLVSAVHDAEKRRSVVRGQFGRALGQLGSLERYVETNGDSMKEILLHPSWGLVVEANVVEKGVLRSRFKYGYHQIDPDTIVQNMVQTESLLPDAHRSVSLVRLSNITVERGGAR